MNNQITPKQRTQTKPKLEMYGGVVPYNFRADYSLTGAFYFIPIDLRILISCTVCGVPPVYWAELNAALQTAAKPFSMWMKKPAALSWIEVGQKIIPYIGESFLPPIFPMWLTRHNIDQGMYLAYLSEFWSSLADEYRIDWDMGSGLEELIDTESARYVALNFLNSIWSPNYNPIYETLDGEILGTADVALPLAMESGKQIRSRVRPKVTEIPNYFWLSNDLSLDGVIESPYRSGMKFMGERDALSALVDEFERSITRGEK